MNLLDAKRRSRPTAQQTKEGRDYWLEYVRVNGYAWEPNDAGLKKLARLLDLKPAYLRKCIYAYLLA